MRFGSEFTPHAIISLDSAGTVCSIMAKRRKLDLSYISAPENDTSRLSENISPVSLPINRRVSPQKTQPSPTTSNRSRNQPSNVIDTISEMGCGAENSNILGLQLQELLEKERRTTQARVANAQDVVQELKQIIEQIPPREKMRVGVEPSLLFVVHSSITNFPYRFRKR